MNPSGRYDRAVGGRRGVTTGDVVLALAAVSIVAALLLPIWRGRSFEGLVTGAEEDVRSMMTSVAFSRDQDGRWPASPPSGDISREDYSVAWSVWDVVDSVEAPEEDVAPTPGDAPLGPTITMLPVVRSIGAITVQSRDTSLLAELSGRFGPGASFVVDKTWVLVLSTRGAEREVADR